MSSEESSDLFFVQLPSGQQRAMTLDDLDAAYQAGAIDERTLVRPDGVATWSTLGAIAGIGAEYDDTVLAAAQPYDRPSYEGPSSLAPTALSLTPPPAMMPASFDALALDDDMPEMPLRSSKKKLVFGALGAAAVVGVLAVVGVTKLGVAKSQLAAAAAAAQPPAAEMKLGVQPPAPAEAPTNASASSRLSDDQKRALADADKKRSDDAAKKRAEKAAQQPAVRTRRGKTADPIIKNGNKFDPLNGAL